MASNDMKTVLEEMVEVFCRIQNMRQEQEEVCRDCRTLLMPWPSRKKKETTNSPSVEAAGIAQGAVSTHPELLVVDKVLDKAGRTRSKYKKNMDWKKTVDRNKVEKEPCAQQVQPETPHIYENCNNNASGWRDAKQEYDGAMGESNHDNRLHRSAADQKQSHIGRKPVVEKRGQKYVPVHKTAPFQTQNPVKRVKPGMTRAQILRQSANVSAPARQPSTRPRGGLDQRTSSASGERFQSRSRKTASGAAVRAPAGEAGRRYTHQSSHFGSSSSSHKSHTGGYASSHTNTDPFLGRSNDSAVVTGEVFPVPSPSPDIPRTPPPGAEQICGVTRGLSDLAIERLDDKTAHPVDNAISGEPQADSRFSLLRDGHKLRMPSKYCKLKSQNRALRQRIAKLSLTRKVESTEPTATSFMNKLETNFRTYYSEEVLKKLQMANKLCDVYDSLSVMLNRLCKQRICDTSQWQEVWKVRTKMQHVLLEFADRERDFNSLVEDLRKDLRAEGNTDGEALTNMSPRHGVRISRVLDSFCSCPNLDTSKKIKYYEDKEFAEYCGLLQKARRLGLELQLTDDFAAALLPSFEKLIQTESSRDAICVYRAAYSLLCNRGTSFPVLIQDVADKASSTGSLDANNF